MTRTGDRKLRSVDRDHVFLQKELQSSTRLSKIIKHGL